MTSDTPPSTQPDANGWYTTETAKPKHGQRVQLWCGTIRDMPRATYDAEVDVFDLNDKEHLRAGSVSHWRPPTYPPVGVLRG